MSALVINGDTISVASGGEGERTIIGERARTFTGSSRNSIRAEKRTFSVQTPAVAASVWTDLQTSIANQVAVTCSGDVLAGDSLSMYVTATAQGVLGTNPLRYVISISGEEV